MIPLIRPEFPNLRAVEKHFSSAWSGKQFTNFAYLFQKAQDYLSINMRGHALPVSSGTTALEIALLSLGLRGKRVALPDFTHSGTILAIVQAGAIPVLFAANERNWVLDLNDLENNLDKFDALIVVSPFGYQVDITAFETFSERHQKPIVYDFAGAFGFFPEIKNIRCYSFHSTKNFGVGEGGCVVFSNKESYEAGLRISNFGTLPDRSIQNEEGLNGKIDELKAACIIAMLEPENLNRVFRRISNKNATLQFYHEQIDQTYLPHGKKMPSLCVLGNLPARELEEFGVKEGIICKRYYPLLSRMPGLKQIERVSESSDKLERCLALPSDVSIGEAYRVVDFVHSFLESGL